MRHRTLLGRVALLAVCVPVAAPGQQAASPAPSARHADAIARARRIIRDSLQRSGAPGASAAVLVDGRVVWEEGFGVANLEQRVAVTPATRFRIGSVSKSLTGIAVGLLVQDGKLDLDAEVQRYVPSFPRKRWPVTVRQLAGHTAGIRHYNADIEWLSAKHYDDVTGGLELFESDSLLFEPGSKFEYSSYGFNLLGAAVQQAAGVPFLRFVSERVLTSLGMSSTIADFPDSIVPHRARFYERVGEHGWRNAPFVDQSNKWPGGGFLSTPHDLLLLGTAIMRAGLLRDSTIALLTTSQRTRDGKETGYGIGWFTDRDSSGRRMVFHSGGSVGGTTHLVVYPEERVAVAMTVNVGGEVWIGNGSVPRQVAALFIRAGRAPR